MQDKSAFLLIIFSLRKMRKKLISELQKLIQIFPEPNSHNQTSMVNKLHLERMNSYLLDATKKGAKVISWARMMT